MPAPAVGAEPTAAPGTPLGRGATRARTTPRSLALIALTIGSGLVLMLVGQTMGSPIDEPSGLGRNIDTTTLALAMLAAAALWLRHRLEDDRLNTEMLVVLGVTAVVVLPADILASELSSTSAGSLATVSRTVLALAVASLLRPNRPPKSPGTRVLALPALTLAGGVGLAFAIDAIGGSSDEFLPLVLGLSSGGFVLLAFLVGVVALRRHDLRLELVAQTVLGLALADSVAFGLDPSPLETLAGKTIRLAVVGSWLVITLLELLNIAMAERESALRAAEETDSASLKLLEEVRSHEQVVHDLRNGLLAVQGGLRALGSGDSREPMLGAVTAEVERLRVSLETARGSSLPREFDVAALVEPMLDCYAASGAAVSFIPDGPCRAYAVPAIAGEIIQNLVDNAFNHGGGQITLWIYRTDGTVHVRVADRGAGVPTHRTAEIFDRMASTAAGSGVGLHISRRLAESQGGTLTCSGRAGGGAIFTLGLPAVASAPPPYRSASAIA